MFEFSAMVAAAAACIAECREDLGMIKDIWDYSSLVEKQFIKWRETLWSAIDTSTMEDATKSFQKDIKALPKKLRATNAFIGFDDSLPSLLSPSHTAAQLLFLLLSTRPLLPSPHPTSYSSTPTFRSHTPLPCPTCTTSSSVTPTTSSLLA